MPSTSNPRLIFEHPPLAYWKLQIRGGHLKQAMLGYSQRTHTLNPFFVLHSLSKRAWMDGPTIISSVKTPVLDKKFETSLVWSSIA